jgi:flagellin-like hook-associated protein FlgL
MTRISSLASNTLLVNQLLKVQSRLFELETQVSSEKVSQDYKGLAIEAQRLVTLENTTSSLTKFVDNNNQMETRLTIVDSALTGIREIVDDFRKNLDIYSTGATKDETQVRTVQEAAYRALKSIEDLLNTEVDGRFLFSGARVDTEPVDFGLSSIESFQAKYDGSAVSYPTTRDAHLEDFSFSANSTTGAANWLTFERDAGATGVSRVTATSAEFANVDVGSVITISGTGGINDGTYEVSAVGGGGTTIDIVTKQLTNEAAVPVTITYQDPDDINNTIELDASVTFTRATSTIAAVVAGDLTGIPAGAKITIAGAAAGPPTNNGSFTVASNDGTNLVIEATRFTDQGSGGAPYFTFTGAANLSFTNNGASPDTITAPAGTFRDAGGNALPAGLKLTIAGTASNNGTFTIASVSADGSTVTLVSTDALTTEANTNGTVTTTTAAGTVAADSYYSGDAIAMTHRVDPDRDFEYAINAVDPAFEKAIRGMFIILQGTYQADGGLDQNPERIGQAKYLLQSGIQPNPNGTPPFGTELTSNIDELQVNNSFNLVLIDRINKRHKDFIGFLDESVARVENVDPLETITRLLDDQRSLEASFQALARIKQLSLINFL